MAGPDARHRRRRAALRGASQQLAGPAAAVERVEDRRIPVPGGEIGVRVYTPRRLDAGTTLPIVLRTAARLGDATDRAAAGSDEAAGRKLLHGTIDQWLADLAALAEIGVGHVLVGLGSMPVQEQLEVMSRLKAAM